jgi:hypothetical protein
MRYTGITILIPSTEPLDPNHIPAGQTVRLSAKGLETAPNGQEEAAKAIRCVIEEVYHGEYRLRVTVPFPGQSAGKVVVRPWSEFEAVNQQVRQP